MDRLLNSLVDLYVISVLIERFVNTLYHPELAKLLEFCSTILKQVIRILFTILTSVGYCKLQ